MKKILITAMCLVTIAVIYYLVQFNKEPVISTSIEKYFSTDFSYDNKLFITGIAQGQKKVKKELPLVKNVVIPHHLLASNLIAQGIYQIANNKHPKTIIILSPNHSETGSCPVITSNTSWNTPYGNIEVDTIKVRKLLSNNFICIDDENTSKEHGIAGLLPYIKYLLPDTKIIPLSFKRNISLPQLEEISKVLFDFVDTSVIASIDFSHGLPSSESLAKDDTTMALINNKEIDKISQLSSQYLDSPPALITLMYLNEMQKNQQVLLEKSDAKEITNKDNSNNTSYFLLGYYETPKTNDAWSLIATGDVMLGRSVNTQSIKNKDFTWAFKNTATLLSSSDITLINLESPLTKDCLPTDKDMIFCGLIDHIQGLNYAGVDIANIANNHIYNQGQKGITETTSVLTSNNISPVGLGKSAIKKIGATTIAFTGFDTTIRQDNSQISHTIKNLKKENQLVIVSFHWGLEYQSKPNKKQIETAHMAIDSGADVVIGNHPHWVQTEEVYKGKPIFYSLGNLIFDQMWSEETKQGMIVKLNFVRNKIVSIDHFPITIFDYGQPRVAGMSTTP